MRFSFIMTTQGNRITDFKRLINSIDNMEYDDYEIILVDQSNNNEIKKIVGESSNFDKINHINVNEMALSKARNIGLKYASGDIIAFPDDDCWYSPKLPSYIKTYLESNKEVDIICCNVFDPIEKKYYGKRRNNIIDVIGINQFNVFKYPISVGIFIRTSRIESILFDESLGAGAEWGSGEETDLLLRLLKHSCKINFNSKLLVYHPIGNENTWDAKKYFNYGLGFGATIKKAFHRKQFLVFLELGEITIRTLGGIFYYFKKNKKMSQCYISRIKGIVLGLVKA